MATLTGIVVTYGLRVIGAIAILIIGYLAAKIATNAVTVALERSRADRSVTRYLGRLARVAIIMVSWIAALGSLGVDTSSMIAVLGAATLALGLALHSTLGHLAAGIELLWRQPFRAQDRVWITGRGGKLVEIGLFATVLNTSDNRQLIIPNGNVLQQPIIIGTANSARLVAMTIRCAPTIDIDQVRALLLEALRG